MTPVEDIREQIKEIADRSLVVGVGGEFVSDEGIDELCILFSTLLDGLVMEERAWHRSHMIPEDEVIGYNNAVEEINSKIATLKAYLK